MAVCTFYMAMLIPQGKRSDMNAGVHDVYSFVCICMYLCCVGINVLVFNPRCACTGRVTVVAMSVRSSHLWGFCSL